MHSGRRADRKSGETATCCPHCMEIACKLQNQNQWDKSPNCSHLKRYLHMNKVLFFKHKRCLLYFCTDSELSPVKKTLS